MINNLCSKKLNIKTNKFQMRWNFHINNLFMQAKTLNLTSLYQIKRIKTKFNNLKKIKELKKILILAFFKIPNLTRLPKNWMGKVEINLILVENL